jgi:hypothetical protein
MVQPFVVGSLFVAFATGMAGFVFAQQAPDLRPARDVLAQAVADGAALGIVVDVARGGDVVLAEALGCFRSNAAPCFAWRPTPRP